RTPDGNAFVEREDVLHLELPEDGKPIVRNGGADARDHRIIVGQHASTMPKGRLAGGNVHVHMERIDHVYVVAARPRRLHDPPMRIKAGVAREHDKFHLQASSRFGDPQCVAKSPATPAADATNAATTRSP